MIRQRWGRSTLTSDSESISRTSATSRKEKRSEEKVDLAKPPHLLHVQSPAVAITINLSDSLREKRNMRSGGNWSISSSLWTAWSMMVRRSSHSKLSRCLTRLGKSWNKTLKETMINILKHLRTHLSWSNSSQLWEKKQPQPSKAQAAISPIVPCSEAKKEG